MEEVFRLDSRRSRERFEDVGPLLDAEGGAKIITTLSALTFSLLFLIQQNIRELKDGFDPVGLVLPADGAIILPL